MSVVQRCFDDLTRVANAYWWRYELLGLEPVETHRHSKGSTFPAHVDRVPVYPSRAFNVVAMVQPARRGGELFLNLGGEVRPQLDPGDVIVFDSAILHGVTEVLAGERVVLVSHAHMRPQ